MSDDSELDGLRTTYGDAAAEPARTLADGDRFADRYSVTRRLGGGGMGVVYLAKDELTGEDVALKLIHPSLVDTNARQRMIEEGVLARKVSSPNVVRVHDVGERDGQIYLVMEYVEGESLRAYMARNMMSLTNAPLGEVVAIVRAILDGLAAAHAQDLVHRDIKPENVMMSGTPGSPDFRLKVLDFGIARGLKTSAFTGSGAIGTPLYMAPEQKTSPGAVGPSADLYSVGRIFYELLLDVPPEGTWNPPSEQRTDVPPALDGVIRKSQQTPRHRYQSVAEFRTAIDEALGASPSPVRETGTVRDTPFNRPDPAPEADAKVEPYKPPEGQEWRGTLRKIEDFDRKFNPGHAMRRKLGMKEAERVSDKSTQTVIMWLAIAVVIGIVTAMYW